MMTTKPILQMCPICYIPETVRAFTHCINQGWAMYWGTSRWGPTEIMVRLSLYHGLNPVFFCFFLYLHCYPDLID